MVIGCGAGLSPFVRSILEAEQIIAVDRVVAPTTSCFTRRKSVSPEEALECVQKYAARTGQNGADSVLEAVGHPQAQRLARACASRG